jgi:hypothetical protein
MEPYAGKVFSHNPFVQHRAISGRIVAVLDAHLTDRALQLIQPISRVVKKHDIHELIATPEGNAVPGSKINDVWYIAFFEVTLGGVIVIGDQVLVGKKTIGYVAGFDDTHLPNHQNIILRAEESKTGIDLAIGLEEIVFITENSTPSLKT